MDIWQITLTLKTDFITSGETRGSLIDVLQDDEHRLFIPATHIKGVVRTEAERIYPEKPACFITGHPYGTKEKPSEIKVCKNPIKINGDCPICRLFGVPNQREVSYFQPILKFLDFYCDDRNTLMRTYVSIGRERGAKMEGALFSKRVVSSVSEFTGYLLMRENLSQDERNLLCGAFHSAAHYGFGSDRSRGLGAVDVSITGISVDAFKKNLISIMGGNHG